MSFLTSIHVYFTSFEFPIKNNDVQRTELPKFAKKKKKKKKRTKLNNVSSPNNPHRWFDHFLLLKISVLLSSLNTLSMPSIPLLVYILHSYTMKYFKTYMSTFQFKCLSWAQTDPLIQKASGMISQCRQIYSTQTKRWVITVGRLFFPSYTYSGMTYLSDGLLVIYLRNNTFIESIILSRLLYSSDLLYISPPEFLIDCTKKIKNDAFVKQQH